MLPLGEGQATYSSVVLMVSEVNGTFRKKLVQIALDNRMCRSTPLVSESYLYWIINEGIGYHTCGYCAGYGVAEV